MRTCRYLGDRGLQAGAQGQHSAAGDTKVWGCDVPLSQGTLCLLGGQNNGPRYGQALA